MLALRCDVVDSCDADWRTRRSIRGGRLRSHGVVGLRHWRQCGRSIVAAWQIAPVRCAVSHAHGRFRRDRRIRRTIVAGAARIGIGAQMRRLLLADLISSVVPPSRSIGDRSWLDAAKQCAVYVTGGAHRQRRRHAYQAATCAILSDTDVEHGLVDRGAPDAAALSRSPIDVPKYPCGGRVAIARCVPASLAADRNIR